MQFADLNELYIRLNKEMFDNKLPNNIVLKWSGRMTKDAGVCVYSVDYTSGKPVRTPVEIRLSKAYHQRFPKELIETMVHEMIHVKFPYDGHGVEFNREMDKLNKKFNLGVKQYATGRAVVNFIYTCKSCQLKYERLKRINELCSYRCSCGGNLDEKKL